MLKKKINRALIYKDISENTQDNPNAKEKHTQEKLQFKEHTAPPHLSF